MGPVPADAPHEQRQTWMFTIEFANGNVAKVARTTHDGDAARVIEELGLESPTPTIFVMGGAGLMTPESVEATRTAVEGGVAQFAAERKLPVIDGGTAAGVMAMLGAACREHAYAFPLIGVAPETQVHYPTSILNGAEPLEENHTHFVLTDGDEFGAESEMIAQLAYALSGRGVQQVLGLIINGGEIARREAYRCAVAEPRFPMLILEGSGRLADDLAAGYRAGRSDDPLINDILKQGSIHFISVHQPADGLRAWLADFFSASSRE